MKIIKPDVQFITPIDGATILKRLEQCGRVCYKSEDKITEGSAEKFVAGIIKRGHEAVLEHCSFTVKFICDRGVSHEIVRHRMASYCQESTRYCNYGKGKFGEEITVIEPCFLEPGSRAYDYWRDACEGVEIRYFDMLAEGCTPQEARSVLPNSLKTEVVMTANIREWRHFLKLRCSPAAHPQMREVALILLDKVHWLIPVCFDDIDITEDEFDLMADRILTSTEWQYRPQDVTREKFIACMKEQNKIGQEFKKQTMLL